MQICSCKHIMSVHKLLRTCTWTSTHFLALYQSRNFSRIFPESTTSMLTFSNLFGHHNWISGFVTQNVTFVPLDTGVGSVVNPIVGRYLIDILTLLYLVERIHLHKERETETWNSGWFIPVQCPLTPSASPELFKHFRNTIWTYSLFLWAWGEKIDIVTLCLKVQCVQVSGITGDYNQLNTPHLILSFQSCSRN